MNTPSPTPTPAEHAENIVMRGMFAARKEVFIDLLKWDLLSLAGQFEIDHFDDRDARYVILTDTEFHHCASARLLQTDRSHCLADLFWFLCKGPVPSGPTVREVSRFCIDRSLSSRERRSVRHQLVTSLAEHALDHGITDYTGVAEKAWFEQIMAFGWQCEALGPPAQVEGRTLCALRIRIDENTVPALRRAGTYEPTLLTITACEGLPL